MNVATQEKAGRKQRIAQEMFEYWINFVYLAIFFAVFAWYRRLILAEYRITYLHYGTAVIEALIMAKVILLGDALRLGRNFEHKPLIFPALHKVIIFTLFMGLFTVLEHTIVGLLHGKGLTGGFHAIMSEGKDELLAQCLITFFAFIPFFAFREVGRVMGNGKLRALLFHHR